MGNVCRYGFVRESDVRVIEVGMNSSITVVGDGGGGVWVILTDGGVMNFTLFWVVSGLSICCSSFVINL